VCYFPTRIQQKGKKLHLFGQFETIQTNLEYEGSSITPGVRVPSSLYHLETRMVEDTSLQGTVTNNDGIAQNPNSRHFHKSYTHSGFQNVCHGHSCKILSTQNTSDTYLKYWKGISP
jgi:hypothetical protein